MKKQEHVYCIWIMYLDIDKQVLTVRKVGSLQDENTILGIVSLCIVLMKYIKQLFLSYILLRIQGNSYAVIFI